MTLRTALEQGTKLLEEGAVGVPRLTAEVLLSHALRCDRVYLFAHPDEELSELCARMREAGRSSCTIVFCENAVYVSEPASTTRPTADRRAAS